VFFCILVFTKSSQATAGAKQAAQKFTPLFTRVLVQRLKPRAVTSGGIQLPESAQARQNVGIVLAVGEKVEKLNIDDRVVLSEFAGTELKIDGEELHLYRDEDILGILKA